jgi:hypothetical protein
VVTIIAAENISPITYRTEILLLWSAKPSLNRALQNAEQGSVYWNITPDPVASLIAY